MSTAPIRVMIVEDSTVVRTLLTHIVANDPALTVASAVGSAEEALAALPSVKPDVISMDIRLPGIDGLEATRRIMAEQPTPIVVISASVERESLTSTMQALRAGALSVVEKPVGPGSQDYAGVAEEIRTQLRIMSKVALVRRRMRAPTERDGAPGDGRARAAPRLIACATSTGGPQALAQLFAALPPAMTLPILLVQHMGATFMPGFASWLDGIQPRKVMIAVDGGTPQNGVVHVAPGDAHLRIDRQGRMRIGQEAPIRGQRPAATALFESVAAHLGDAAIGVVLTGMGEDGAPGVAAMVAAGARVFAEHEASAVVYGMPAAAVRMGAAALPLAMIGQQIAHAVAKAPAA